MMSEVNNPFGECLWLDFNPEYGINLFHVEIFLQKFLEDEVWNARKIHISDLSIVEESKSQWKDRMGYIYFN